MGFIEGIILLLLLLVLFAWNLPLLIWPVLTFVLLTAFSLISTLSAWFLAPLWALFFCAVIFVCIPYCRRGWLVAPLLKTLKASFPEMSQTEKDAIEAGDVCWEGELFSGKPNWQMMLKAKKAELTEEEQRFINEKVPVLCGMLDEWEIGKAKDLPEEVWRYIKSEKFWAMGIPKAYGGLEFSALAHSEVIMRIATCSAVAAITVMVPNSLGPAELLIHYGTDKQKQDYLPKLAIGEEVPCFALTSLDAGSDASSMTDYGVLTYGEFEGEQVLGIELNWNKRYITLAPVATVLGLAFRLYDPEHLLGDQEECGITLCLIPTDYPGVETGRRHQPMQIPFMNGPTRGEKVFVPLDWVIGGKDQLGQGWRMLMECLSAGRGISLPATATAMGQLLYQTTGAYARSRRQFHLPISQFEGVQTSLADIAGKVFMQEAMRTFVLASIDEGKRPAIASAIAKYHLTEMARDIVNHSMDIHGGKGIQAGPNNYLLPAYMANPIGITVEGANILTRNLIIFGQGVMRCHPFLLKEIQILQEDGPKQLLEFDRSITRHITYTLSNFARCVLTGLTGGKLSLKKADKPIRKYIKQLDRMSSVLALLTDVCLLIYGGRLKRKENTSARLGDMVSYLFIASSVLKYYADHDYDKSFSSYVHWSLRYCLWKMQEAILCVLDNLPLKVIAVPLRWAIFPYGRRYTPPSDRLNHSVVKPMLEFSKAREALTAACCHQKDSPVGLLEQLLEKSVGVSGLLKQLHRAKADKELPAYGSFEGMIHAALEKNLIQKEEHEQLMAYHHLSCLVLSVDEFNRDLSELKK
jgi:acyl-CoA dehydrogenase